MFTSTGVCEERRGVTRALGCEWKDNPVPADRLLLYKGTRAPSTHARTFLGGGAYTHTHTPTTSTNERGAERNGVARGFPDRRRRRRRRPTDGDFHSAFSFPSIFAARSSTISTSVSPLPPSQHTRHDAHAYLRRHTLQRRVILITLRIAVVDVVVVRWLMHKTADHVPDREIIRQYHSIGYVGFTRFVEEWYYARRSYSTRSARSISTVSVFLFFFFLVSFTESLDISANFEIKRSRRTDLIDR